MIVIHEYMHTRVLLNSFHLITIHYDTGDVQTTANGKTFVGSGNPQACVNLLREHVVYKIKDSSRCPSQQCAIGDVYQPSLPDQLQFYAIGAFMYTLPSIGALNDDGVFVPEIGYQKAFEFCELVMYGYVLSIRIVLFPLFAPCLQLCT